MPEQHSPSGACCGCAVHQTCGWQRWHLRDVQTEQIHSHCSGVSVDSSQSCISTQAHMTRTCPATQNVSSSLQPAQQATQTHPQLCFGQRRWKIVNNEIATQSWRLGGSSGARRCTVVGWRQRRRRSIFPGSACPCLHESCRLCLRRHRGQWWLCQRMNRTPLGWGGCGWERRTWQRCDAAHRGRRVLRWCAFTDLNGLHRTIQLRGLTCG